MDGKDLLRGQFQQLNKWLHMTISDVEPEVAARSDSDWTINPIGEIYLHMAVAQDMSLTRMSGADQPILISGGWGAKLGIDEPSGRQTSESSGPPVDLATAREYMAAVAGSLDEFLASATDEQLAQEVDGPAGKTTSLEMLANIGVNHVAGHWGEIAALKGVQGKKGLRF